MYTCAAEFDFIEFEVRSDDVTCWVAAGLVAEGSDVLRQEVETRGSVLHSSRVDTAVFMTLISPSDACPLPENSAAARQPAGGRSHRGEGECPAPRHEHALCDVAQHEYSP